MANYEELAELGFEGIDKFADKYHDKVFDHLPAWRQKQQKQQQAQARRDGKQHQQQQHNQGPPANEHQRHRRDSSGEHNVDHNENNRQMSSYVSDRRYDSRDDRAPRADRVYQPRAPSPPPGYANEYDVGRSYPDRGRPAPSRMRSTSWSPPRNERSGGDESRRRRHSRSRTRSGSRDGTRNQRIAATLIGGLVGGFAGNRVRKGQKFDTAATIGGAVLGGIASRELAERVGNRKDERKDKREHEQQTWEQKHGDHGRDDDGRRSRDSRGWCDRCRSDRSRCRCR